VAGHGTGVAELTPEGQVPGSDRALGVGLDEGSGGDCLEPGELGLACRAVAERLGRPINVLALDACFSGTVEVVWEVCGAAEVLCAHPGALYAPGMPWGELVGSLAGRPEITAEEFAGTYVRSAQAGWPGGVPPPGAAVAAVRLGQTAALVGALGELARELRAEAPAGFAAVTKARAAAAGYGPGQEYRDLGELCAALARELPGTRTADLASAVVGCCREAAIAGRGAGGGPAILLPPNLTAFPPAYADVGFARESGWGAFLADYLGYLRGLLSPSGRRGESVGEALGSGSDRAPELATAGAA